MTTTLSSIVRPAAQIVTIVDLAKGSVYKRLENDSASRHRFVFGVVEDIVSDGDTTAISAIEYDGGPYGTPTVKQAIYSATSELTLFPATPDEVRVKFAEMAESQEREIETAERSLVRKREMLEQIRQVGSLDLAAPAFVSLDTSTQPGLDDDDSEG
jgi:hypothetical protein